MVLSIVKWRAIVSLGGCVVMWLFGWSLLHPAMDGGEQLHDAGVLDAARMLSRPSRIPEVVEAETMALRSDVDTQRGLVEAVLTKRLRCVAITPCVSRTLTSLQIY
ncbi:hypothetical protein B0H19DRAFT_195510 [Mycena capillaripes]|nr:hypothetical protein B0H19DRAFT_195510 [Mycena capillaripes]